MTTTRRLFPISAFALLLAAAALACNLSSEGVPPTLVPRATSTPPPTLGVSTLAPEELPQQVATAAQGPAQPALSPLTPILAQVQPDRLMGHVAAMQNMYTRHMFSTQSDPSRGIGAAAAYILETFNTISAETNGALTVFSPHRFEAQWREQRAPQENIVAVIGGREAGGGLIVVGAHYDSVSVAFEDGTAYAPGANDNASGVAAMLELARILAQPAQAERQRSTIMFVAFGAEEMQRQGSIAFVREYLQASNIAVDAMINLDIIGSSTAASGAVDDNRIRLFSAEPNTSVSRQLAREINLIAERHLPAMSVEVQPTVDREGRYSDHISFSDAGYASVRFIEMLENPNSQHTDADTLTGIRASYLTSATQTVLVTLVSLASGPRPPENIVLRDDGVADSAGLPLRTLVWQTVPDATGYIVALRPPGSLIYNNYFVSEANFVQWSGFRADRFEAVAIAAQDATGLMGPLSFEYMITS